MDIEGFEIKGVGDKISYKEAVANWWRGDNYYNGNGIAVNGHHIEIRDNILGYIPAQAIAVKRADYVTIKNNIVYNSAWWSVGGTNAMSINDSIAVDDENITHNKIIGNLIFGVESRIFSRVWKKGFANLTIDEGGAILVQVNDGNYSGRYLVKDNTALFIGKGIISNKTANVDFIHNTIYNSGTTMTGYFRGLRGNKADYSSFKYNAVKIFKNEGMTLSLSKDIVGVESIENCAIKGSKDKFSKGFTYADKLFSNPQNLDFSIDESNECNKSIGADIDNLNTLIEKAKSAGIEIKPTNYKVDYVQETKDIIDAIPSEAEIDWSEYSESEPSSIYVNNLPNDVEGRPESFRLDIVHSLKREDIAYQYAKATQGTKDDYRYYQPASWAIDNNDSTFNHTRGGAKGENWLCLELPKDTKIDTIVIQNGNGFAYRLTNAKVYIGNRAYNNNLDDFSQIATLSPVDSEQIFKFYPPKIGSYLLIKGEQRSQDDRHIHLKKVEVHGQLPKEPKILNKKVNLLFDKAELNGTLFKVYSIDYQNDNIIYSINNSRFSIDKDGNIKAKEALEAGSYDIKVTISDGLYSSSKDFTLTISDDNSLSRLLKSGDIKKDLATKERLIKEAIKRVDYLEEPFEEIDKLFANASIEYNPGKNSQIFNLQEDASSLKPILAGSKGKILALASNRGSRVILYGSNPF